MSDRDLDEDTTIVGTVADDMPVETVETVEDAVGDTETVEDTEDTEETGAGKGGRKRLTVIVAVVVVVALVAAGVGGWLAWSKHELDTAKADCASAAETVKGVKAEYAKLVSGDAKTASGITAEQVKDGATVETLATELKASEPESVACPVKDVKGLKDATSKLNTQTDWYKTHKASLNKAVGNVNQSKLDKVIDDANTLLADSDGKVADNAVRDELGKAIEAKDEQAINEATQKVNDSITAKQKADEEAKAQAEAEAAAAQTQSYTNANTGYSGYSGYSGGNSSGSGSTYSAPQTSTQSTPSTQSNNNSTSGGDVWWGAEGSWLGDTTLHESTFHID